MMGIVISESTAEEALMAAARSGYEGVVEDLLNAGVSASSSLGIAALLAAYNGFPKLAARLRSKIDEEQRTNRLNIKS